MSPVHLKNLGFQRNQPEDRKGLSRTRRPGRGHLEHSGGLQETEGNHTLSAIQFPIQQEPQSRGLERHGSSFSAPPTPQRFISMEHGQEEVQLGIPLGRTWSKFPEDFYQTDGLRSPYYTPKAHKKQAKSALQWLYTIEKPTDQWPRVTILHNPRKFPGGEKNTRAKTRPPSARGREVRPNDPEAVGFGEKSPQEPEVVENNSRVSIPNKRNINPTQIEHNVFTPESNLNGDALWLQMSQFAEQTRKQFAELEASH
ncbi:hypothetical protein O181_110798 [Austropuccinia psidii MF-1]|uniref:Uncharacterized protein n=1 Tax=Austropuccinia psidii MF-1 TaxID=1389203 RepID=A0A9Q3PR60_9BASI|nr:hypothetical protein [Austropuccinia psidii MF-1]